MVPRAGELISSSVSGIGSMSDDIVAASLNNIFIDISSGIYLKSGDITAISISLHLWGVPFAYDRKIQITLKS